MTFVRLQEARDVGRYGGKATHLGAALRAGLPVPGGVAIAWEDVVRLVRGEASVSEVGAALAHVRRVAVRSSAADEDGATASFAGQHLTVLGACPRTGLAAAIGAVHDSAHTPAALGYRRKLGLPETPRMGVVVQELVESDVAGVLFSRDPITGEDVRVIEASWGLGEAVVSGIVTPDRFRVARGGRVLARDAGEKDVAIRWREKGDGTEEVPVEADRIEALCLADAQLAALDALTTRCEALFVGAQDLEFAFVGPTLHLLQRRAITRG